MAALRFSCTSCGRCCHGLRLTLSVAEAIAWAARGGLVQILCHAAPEVGDRSELAGYKRQRSFAARSGDVAIRVQVFLVARFEGACPNLLPDLRCGIYDRRPDVCRIYPAEVIPGRVPDAAYKLCPPEAWGGDRPVFQCDDGSIADPVTRQAIAATRDAGLRDIAARRALVTGLGIDVAALENEGFAVWTIAADRLVAALRTAVDRPPPDGRDAAADWRFLSLRPGTADLIASAGAHLAPAAAHPDLDYLPLY